MADPQSVRPTPPAPPTRASRLRAWIRRNRVPLLFALLLVLMVPCRDLWAPDEPDFAQCVREMRERGSWLLPYLNGLPYSEKPILFYWLMKLSAVAGEWLTGGAGFSHGIAAWALRLPSVVAAAGFLFAFRAWAERFVDRDAAEPACLVLATVPIWVLQAQMIQIDMVFAALLAWSWCSWLGGYLLLRGQGPGHGDRPPVGAGPAAPGRAAGGEGAAGAGHRSGGPTPWFMSAYATLALAFLAKGPLALVLTLPLWLAFLAWQRDLRALGAVRAGTGLLIGAALVLPWYLAATLQGGAAYAYQMVIHQNVERALHAWDHIQPPYQYVQYLAGDFFPWTLLLPALVLALARPGRRDNPAVRFLVLAVAVPFLLLSCSQSKQSKYILMIYPFLALLLARLLVDLDRVRARRLGWLLVAGLALPGLALAAVALGAGGHHLQAQVGPYLGPLRLLAGVFLAGAATLAARSGGSGRFLARTTAATLGLAFLVTGTWGFRRLDPLKGYRAWTAAAGPLMAGRQVYFWQTIRSGVMVYTDHRMPELRSRAELERTLGPDQRLVAMRREWDADAWGMDARARQEYEILLRMPVGGGEALLLRRRPIQPPPPRAASPE